MGAHSSGVKVLDEWLLLVEEVDRSKLQNTRSQDAGFESSTFDDLASTNQGPTQSQRLLGYHFYFNTRSVMPKQAP
jgi:hypothetical protein